ncbi:hypothetical protein RSOL_057890 [Rhizoctonia solani AG-3 Rhs1AP]|uniref:Uncharacterized protein n=2 Tax=Rhizoctonia solani AG-3 TaxID=1086053 RepID=A0A074S3Q7_9AGAM|nr:hypothetical protein RSOL_057890 [Rhizoctonia solani AG-3 Rhs1AP]KEP52180.1 hypothetical protein V565_049080 [Rhizoctonia solani 123E]
MSSELFDYIHAVKPSFSDEKRAKVGLLVMHYITLSRVSGGGVQLDNVLTTSGELFVRKVIRNRSIVRDLGFALKVDMSFAHDSTPIPEGLRRLCATYHIGVEACIRRNKSLTDARHELWDLVIFVRVALAVMTALHKDTLSVLDEVYHGHRPPGYQPKRKWLGLGVEHLTAPIRARDLPRAKAPRAIGAAVATSTSGPVRMARKTSDKPSISSSSNSSGSKSGIKRPAPYPASTRCHTPARQIGPRARA